MACSNSFIFYNNNNSEDENSPIHSKQYGDVITIETEAVIETSANRSSSSQLKKSNDDNKISTNLVNKKPSSASALKTCENDLKEQTISKDVSEQTENNSDETIVFDAGLVKGSHSEAISYSWNGDSKSTQNLRKLKRSRSWSAEEHGDLQVTEIRLIRERLLRTQGRIVPAAMKWFTPRQRLTLISLALVDFMSFCSMSIMAPFFPKEASEKGLSDTMSGLVFSFYAFVMFLTSPIFGKMMPYIGAKFMFITGILVTGCCNCLFGTLELLHDTNIFTIYCFVIRGVSALGASAFSTASYVFVVNAFPNNIGSVLGILETFVGLGMSVGPAVGGLLYSIGGFGLPFYVLGSAMLFIVPINFLLLIDNEDFTMATKSGSIIALLKIPSILITGLVIVVVSNTWAFLDPTLEPHLRQFNLSTEQIGLIFLLFSALYAIFSPLWGWVADRIHNHWCMMVWGLLLCTIGLILLGPCPFIPGLPKALWLDLVSLSILGIAVALTLLPTFQGVLTSSIEEGGCPFALGTYSVVAGIWASCYSLGEVLGPALGGFMSSTYGFPLSSTICAFACFTMAIVAMIFFSLRESSRIRCESLDGTSSVSCSDSTWPSNIAYSPQSVSELAICKEDSPLLTPDQGHYQRYGNYGTSSPKVNCKGKMKDRSASIKEFMANVFMFKFITKAIHRARHFSEVSRCSTEIESHCGTKDNEKNLYNTNNDNNHSANVKEIENETKFLIVTSLGNEEIYSYEDIVKHNFQKMEFYEKSLIEENINVWDPRNNLTNAKGTVSITATGACEV